MNCRDFAPHFAARLETGCTSDATVLVYNEETGDIEFIEPAAGGRIMAVITIPSMRPQVGTIRPGTFKYAPSGRRERVEVIREEFSAPPQDIGLSTRIVVVKDGTTVKSLTREQAQNDSGLLEALS